MIVGTEPFGVYPFGTIPSVAPTVAEPFDVGLYTLLSAKLTTPVYPGHIPQDATPPAITYTAVDENPYYLLVGNATGLTTVEYQFSIFSSDYLECVTIERNLRQALHGFKGFMGRTLVYSARLTNRLSADEPNTYATDDYIYNIAVEYTLTYRETVPTFLR